MNKTADFTFSFESSESPKRIFERLLHVQSWWSGIFSESFSGSSAKLNDEFTFSAGDGAHYSKQKLIELIPEENLEIYSLT